MFMLGQHPRWSLGRLLTTSVTTIEAIKREPQRETTGAIAAPTPTDHSISYPGRGASKIIMAAASPIFRPARSANNHENLANEQKTEDTLETSIAASPLLFRTWRLRASSAHPRHPESDSFLSCATKKKKRLAAARTRQRKPSLSSTRVAVFGWALCDAVRSSRLFRILFRLTTINSMPFPHSTSIIGDQNTFFFQIKLKFYFQQAFPVKMGLNTGPYVSGMVLPCAIFRTLVPDTCILQARCIFAINTACGYIIFTAGRILQGSELRNHKIREHHTHLRITYQVTAIVWGPPTRNTHE